MYEDAKRVIEVHRQGWVVAQEIPRERKSLISRALQLSWMFVMAGGTVEELIITTVETVERCSRSLRLKADR